MNVARYAATFKQGLDTAEDAVAIVTWYTHRADVLGEYELADLVLGCAQFRGWWEEGDRVSEDPEVQSPRLDYSTRTRLVAIEGRQVRPGLGPVFVSEFTAIPGLNEDGPAPPQCATLISWRTAEDSRRGRGRWYLPPVVSGLYDASGAYVENFLSTFVADEPGAATIAKWGRAFYRNVADSAGSTPDDRVCVFSDADNEARTVTEVRAPHVLCTQRRRRIPELVYETQDVSA